MTKLSPATPCQRCWCINRNQPATSEVTARRAEIGQTNAAAQSRQGQQSRTRWHRRACELYIASDQSSSNHNLAVSASGLTNQQSKNTTGTAVYQQRAAKRKPF